MELKRFQTRALKEVSTFLEALERASSRDSSRPSLDAWDEVGGTERCEYKRRKTGDGRDLPTFCLKIPTGGGKTLLATHVLGETFRTILKARNGAGLVLWCVPSQQIYADTLRSLRDRHHPYRQAMEFAVNRRVELWEKNEIHRLTPSQLATQLNVLVIQLASVNRTLKDSLRFFQDSGGNIMLHFPSEERTDEHAKLGAEIPNLELIDEKLVRTSLANLVRRCRPPVILDEGHKGASVLARDAIARLNPSIIVELSATPPEDANVLVSVSGQELLDEEMIKLPINVSNSNETSWQECLVAASERRRVLAETAKQLYRKSGQRIRPIVLVQVERTGKNQRDGRRIHAEDAREFLTQRLGVPAQAIAVKSSSKNEIEGLDLLAEGCPIEWIITKGALQEGWDCPFAYVLVSLSAGKSKQAMTQLVGRVLRQPYVRRTGFAELDESYVFCVRASASDVVHEVKSALEREGYEGTLESAIDHSSPDAVQAARPVARIRKQFRQHYGKPFTGRIFLPRFCVRDGRRVEELDYFRDLLAHVDVGAFDFDAATSWKLSSEVPTSDPAVLRVGLGSENVERGGSVGAPTDTDSAVLSWMVASLAFDHYSQKDVRSVASTVSDRVLKAEPSLRGHLTRVRHLLRDRLAGFIEAQTDLQTEARFKKLHEDGKLLFYLDCVDGNFEIPAQVELRATRRMTRDDHTPVQRSLFDAVPDTLNGLERDVALFLDRQPKVLWWYRNLVGEQHFSIQGFRKGKIYPDFVVQLGTEQKKQKPSPVVLVVESKGAHLKGNDDTNYKRSVASYFDKVGRKTTWQNLSGGFKDRQFRFQVLDQGDYEDEEWKSRLAQLLNAQRKD